MRFITLLIVLLLPGLDLAAANLTQEQRISEQLQTPSLVGEALWLDAGDVRFLAIQKKTDANRRLGGAILLHDLGAHADGQALIGPLRLALARRGWDTLSLQLPRPLEPLNADSRAEALALGVQRVQAAVDYFTIQRTTPLVLVGHGLGAETALAWLNERQGREVSALVAIGLAVVQEGEEDPVIQAITKLQRPLLDLYGDQDQPAVVATAQARRGAAMRARHPDYRQDRVTGADHQFNGLLESLQQRVASWLRRIALKEARHPS